MPYGAHSMDMPPKRFMSQPTLTVMMNNDPEQSSSQDGSIDESTPVSASSQRRFSVNPETLLMDKPTNNSKINSIVAQPQTTFIVAPNAIINGSTINDTQARVRTPPPIDAVGERQECA